MRPLRLFCVTLSLLGAPALAQEASPPPWHHGEHHHEGARFQARLMEIETSLHLTPAQKPLWETYVGVLKETMRGRFDHLKALRAQPPADAPTQLDMRVQLLKGEIDALGREKQALDPLWGALDSDQRATLSKATAWHRHDKGDHHPD